MYSQVAKKKKKNHSAVFRQISNTQYVKFSLELSGKRVGEMQTLSLETLRNSFINSWIMNVWKYHSNPFKFLFNWYLIKNQTFKRRKGITERVFLN